MDPIAAEGFHRAADAYDRGRPAYPVEAVTWLLEALRIGPETTVVDVGAGTGKFTAQLVPTGRRLLPWSRSTPCGLPSPPISRLWSRSPARLKRFRLRPPLPTRSSRRRRSTGSTPLAVAEFHRVLGDGGRLGVIWNERDTSVDWARDLDAIVEPYRGEGAPPSIAARRGARRSVRVAPAR